VQLSPNAALNEGFPAALDERHVLFTSSPSGEPEVSQLDLVTHEIRSLGEGQMAEPSHDRRWMAYSRHAQGGIWLRPLDGSGSPRRLTNDLRDSVPRFSHDDRHIIFVRGLVNDDTSSLWIVPVDGGEARQLVAAPALAPMTSAADDRIFYLERTAAGERLMFTREHDAPRPAQAVLPAKGRSWFLSRSRDGRRILVAHDAREILELDVDSKRPPRIRYQLANLVIELSYAADDEQVIATMDFPEGDVWLAEGRFP
jgi:Tol biopolymer transport system component